MLTDPRVFRDDHVPRDLQHRHSELEQLARALDPGTYGDEVDDVLIAGPSGVGKTALARHYLERAQAHDRLQWAYIPTLGNTTGSILRETLRELADTHVPNNRPIEEVRRDLAALDQRSVVVLDEADDLPETDTLDNFRGLPHLSLIAICHDRERWLSRLDSQKTRFRTVIQPDRYGVDELTDILRPRARQGLEPNAVDGEQLREIADGSAGVARRGIQALRAAAELATEREHPRIQSEDVADCFERARRRIRKLNLASLPHHHQVLYELVRTAEDGEIRARELNERYEADEKRLYAGRPMTPISRRARRRKLTKLQEYDLLRVEEVSGGRRYEVVDTELDSPIAIPAT
jgi:Cdc6-like AAA superfamily ATPase